MLKKFLIGTIAVFALAFALNASAAMDFGPTTLKVGSTGQYVMNVQTVVGAVADGQFGPMTKAKVMAWQASNGLVADGIVGPATKNAMNAGSYTGTTDPTLPAGCMSTAGFSTLTGVSCSSVSTLPAGCTSTAGFSPLTGVACSTVVTPGNLPAGCTSTVGFSVTTGASCSSQVQTGTLTGGAGDAIITATTSDTESEIVEGATEKVLAFRVEADGSDIALNNVKISLSNAAYDFSNGTDFTTAGTGSMRIERYIDEVTVWDGSTKIATISADEFTKSSNLYSKSITLNNVVVKQGSADRKTFYVAIKALSNIDSTDLAADSWDIRVEDIRYTDATGVVLVSTYNQTVANQINFVDSASSSDIKVKVSKDSTSPAAGNVQVSSTGSTSDVPMLAFKIKAEGTDVSFDTLNFVLTGTGATPAEIASEFALYKGSTKLGDLTSHTTNDTYAIDLYDPYTVSEGDTDTFEVVAKINKIAVGNFGQGDSLKVDLAALTNLLEDETSGNTITSITGSALGENQAFYSEGLNASGFKSSLVTTTSTTGATTKQTYTISYDLTAFGNTYYIPKTVERNVAATPSLATTDNGTTGLGYSIETSAGAMAEVATVASSHSALSSNASTVSNYFEIADGEKKTFTVTIEVTPGATAGFYHVQLGQVRYDLNQTAVGTDEAVYVFAPAQEFETADGSLPTA